MNFVAARMLRHNRRLSWLRFSFAVTLTLFALATSGALQEQSADDTSPSASEAVPGTQPIAFSHQVHVTTVGLDCQLCHSYARRGPVAGIPSVSRCVGCHEVVRPDSPEIQKVLAFWENQTPIPWVRVHRLDDFIRFNHKRHLEAGLACETCHGDVGSMMAAEQVAPLSMGWCLGCHREREASENCQTCHK